MPSFTKTSGKASFYDVGLLADYDVDQQLNSEKNNLLYMKFSEEELLNLIEQFKFKYGYHPLKTGNIIYYGNLDEYISKAEAGDQHALTLLDELYNNPLSFIYKSSDERLKKLLKHGFEIYQPVERYKNFLTETYPVLTINNYNLRKVTTPYIKNHDSLIGEVKINILMLCDSYEVDESYDPGRDFDIIDN